MLLKLFNIGEMDEVLQMKKTRKKRIIIVGGSGMIGGALVHYFNKYCTDDVEVLSPNSKRLNLKDGADITQYFRTWQPDYIINGAISSIDSDPSLAYKVNYLGAVNLAKVATSLSIPYIFISSAAVLPEGTALGEQDHLPLHPGLSNYAKSKLMCEKTLQHLHAEEGLDFTIIRLAIVYGKHDHKIQGFHRLLFSVADRAMPVLFTGKNVKHSYTNAKKVPLFVNHILKNREEFSGQIYNFVDEEPVELGRLILKIRDYLEVSRPKKIYFPLAAAKFGAKCLRLLLKIITGIGIEAKMPPELMFLDQFYKTQILSIEKLRMSSFVDPAPEETVYSKLPEMIEYYVKRWENLNLISGFNKEFFPDSSEEEQFCKRPEKLLTEIHTGKRTPFTPFVKK